MGHGRLTAGMILVVSAYVPFVAFLHLLIYPAAGIWLGLNGYQEAWRHRGYHSVAQLRQEEREWALWGVIGVVLALGGLVVMLLLMAPAFQEAMRTARDMGI